MPDEPRTDRSDGAAIAVSGAPDGCRDLCGAGHDPKGWGWISAGRAQLVEHLPVLVRRNLPPSEAHPDL